MFNTRYYISLALIASVISSQAFAASDTGNATATIVTPIAISAQDDLAFGKLSANTGGTVQMTTASVRSITGGDVVLVSTGNTSNAATFDITGEPNATYAITLPADGVVTIDDAGAGVAMAVDSFVSDPAATGTLSGAGAETVNVGATLTVGNAQTPGAYTGTFTVTVEYN